MLVFVYFARVVELSIPVITMSYFINKLEVAGQKREKRFGPPFKPDYH